MQREASISMVVDSVSPLGVYASPTMEEAPVKNDRKPAPAKGLIRRGSLGQ
jgi:hypothetical protein